MGEVLALFPLRTVLFPGVPLPLHVFEERYRRLLRDLLDGPGPWRFGVVAIRHGQEVGDDDPLLHEVGCVAELRQIEPYPDGRCDLVAVGGPRFRLVETDASLPYLVGSVSYLDDPPGEGAADAAAAVRLAFPAYWDAMTVARGTPAPMPDLRTEDDTLLSWLVASALHVDLPERQELLAVPDVAARLRRELDVLRRETALLLRAGGTPTHGPFSLN